jgi:hypothetical protein
LYISVSAASLPPGTPGEKGGHFNDKNFHIHLRLTSAYKTYTDNNKRHGVSEPPESGGQNQSENM